MNDLGPIGRPSAGAFGHNGRISTNHRNAATPAAPRAGDEVELSSTARLLSKLHELPDVRQDVVDRVKQEIANGTYETPEKLEAAIGGLIEDLV